MSRGTRVGRAIGALLGRRAWRAPRYQSFALYDNRLFFPTVGLTPNGMYREIEPVQILSISETELATAIAAAFAAERPDAPPYYPGPPHKSPLQVAAKCQSWISFARGSLRFAVVEAKTGWQIWVSEGEKRDEMLARELPGTASPAEIAAAVVEVAGGSSLWQAAPHRPTRPRPPSAKRNRA